MPFHLIAFAPFMVLAGTGAAVGAMSLVISVAPPKGNKLALPPIPARMPEQRSAEILFFPAPKARPTLAEIPRARPVLVSVK